MLKMNLTVEGKDFKELADNLHSVGSSWRSEVQLLGDRRKYIKDKIEGLYRSFPFELGITGEEEE